MTSPRAVFMLSVLLLTLHGVIASAAITKPATRPVSDMPGADIVVAQDGSTKYQTIADALASLDPGAKDRVIIFIRAGVYREHLVIHRDCVTLRGESKAGTRIEYSLTAGQWIDQPDAIGRGVVNINGDDCVLENLTIENTNKVRTHAFALYGRGTRTLTQDCDFLGEGNDTVGLWPTGGGMFYHARCTFRGQVDFLCPRGWCYVVDSVIQPVNDKVPLWHDGDKDPTKKFVLKNTRVEGVQDFPLARYPRDAQFYFIGCKFSKFTQNPIDTNAKDPSMRWGRRIYFANCQRDGGNQPWHADNLDTAAGSPSAADVTAAWTFGDRWDPERRDSPRVQSWSVRGAERRVDVQFTEALTVRGELVLLTRGGKRLPFAGGNGTSMLSFAVLDDADVPTGIEANRGRVIASQATTAERPADMTWPQPAR